MAARHLVSTVLGVVVIVDAIISPAKVVQWVAGLVLLGIIPVDALLAARKGGDQSKKQP